MNTIRFILIMFVLLLACYIGGNAQTVVSQQFIDDANRSFIEVVALRKLEEARKAEVAAKDALIASQNSLILTKDALIKAQDEQISRLIIIKCNETRYFWGLIKSKRCF